MINSFEEIDKVFYNDGQDIAESVLQNGINPRNINYLTEKLYHITDGLIDAFINRLHKEKRNIDCKKGCYYCCTQAVFVNPREAFYLQHYIEKELDDETKHDLKKKARKKNEVTRKLDIREVITYKHPCPLLINNKCIAYAARPMACRVYLSMSKQSCIDFYKTPDLRSSYARLYEFPLHAGRMLNEGISSWFREHGTPINALSIESALDYVLQDSRAAEKWISGENNFEERKFSEEDLKILENFELNL